MVVVVVLMKRHAVVPVLPQRSEYIALCVPWTVDVPDPIHGGYPVLSIPPRHPHPDGLHHCPRPGSQWSEQQFPRQYVLRPGCHV